MSEEYVWDGVIRHKENAGTSGWRRWKCKCPDCYAAGKALNARKRAQEQAKRDGLAAQTNFQHGLTGYRQHRCRCDVCSAAGRRFNEDNRAAGRNRRAYKERPPGATSIVVEEPVVDWDELSHLRPGYNVRRRKAA